MNRQGRFWWITLAAVLGVALTASLGTWQLSRAAQKLALQAAAQRQGARAVLDTAALQRAPDSLTLLHQRARVRGSWLGAATVFLDNRPMQGRVGFFVVTPLLLEGGGALAVQRGWVARDFVDRTQLPPVDTPSGTVELEGRIALAPSPLLEIGSSVPGAIRQNLDLVQWRVQTGLPLMPVTLLQIGEPSDGLLRQWPEVNLGIERNYGYAFQWFGLATLIVLLYLWFQMLQPLLRSRKPSCTDV